MRSHQLTLPQSVTFKQPALPQPSKFGLDKLAAEKRAAAAASASRGEPSVKRQKTEDEEDRGSSSNGGVFKGQYLGPNV